MRKLGRFAGVVIAGMQLASVAMAQRAVMESGAISGVLEGRLSIYKGVPFARRTRGAFEKRCDFLLVLQYYILQEDQAWMISHLQSLRALHN
jgi:hypothetical protein